MILQYILLVLGVLSLLIGVVLLYRPCRVAAAVPACVGLLLLHWSYFIAVHAWWLPFWCAATVIVAALVYLQPAGEIDGHRSSNIYVASSALAGALLGMVANTDYMVLGTVLGAFVGQMAYSRTPHGQWLAKGGGKTMLHYYAAKCLPVVVATAIIAIAIEGLLVE
ncbi:MAG: hypothetical protein IJT30_03520 [Muribaculaceae bacterium]|nr:hypothetical protein [Muribaculaceae bacterium]